MLKKLLDRLFSIKSMLFFAIIVGSLLWSLVMFRSGLLYEYGIGFWGPHGHDGMWHLALIESLSRGSNEIPILAGNNLTNYHIGFDLFLAVINKLTGISSSFLYFQLFPVVASLSIGYLVYKFVFLLTNNKRQALGALVFVYLGGSWGWVVTLVRGQGLGGESMFWSQQAISTLVNPPFAMSLITLLLGLIFLTRYVNKNRGYDFFGAVVFFVLSIQIKVYGGLIVLFALLLTGLWWYLVKRRLGILVMFGVVLILIWLTFPAFRGQGASLLVFKPFWFLETMMQISDRVGWPRFGEAMVNYRYGNVWLKAFLAYAVAFMVFWYGNMGMRFLAEYEITTWFWNYRKMGAVRVFLLSCIACGIVVPMLFLQKGTPWNTIQFFYYTLFFMSIIAGIRLGKVKQKRYWLILGVFLIPTTLGTLKNIYLTKQPPAYLSRAENEALLFLKTQPEGIVLTYLFDEIKSGRAKAPKPLYLYVTSSYVAAFSGKSVFLEDEMNLEITQYNWKDRKEEINQFYNSLDQQYVRDFLKKNNISYIYWVKPERARLGETQLGIERVFENQEVDIYKVIE